MPWCGQTLAGPNKKSDVSIGPFLRFSFLPRHNGVLFELKYLIRIHVTIDFYYYVIIILNRN